MRPRVHYPDTRRPTYDWSTVALLGAMGLTTISAGANHLSDKMEDRAIHDFVENQQFNEKQSAILQQIIKDEDAVMDFMKADYLRFNFVQGQEMPLGHLVKKGEGTITLGEDLDPAVASVQVRNLLLEMGAHDFEPGCYALAAGADCSP